MVSNHKETPKPVSTPYRFYVIPLKTNTNNLMVVETRVRKTGIGFFK